MGSTSKQPNSSEIQEGPLSPSYYISKKKVKTPEEGSKVIYRKAVTAALGSRGQTPARTPAASSLMSDSDDRTVFSRLEPQRTPDEDATAQRDDFPATERDRTGITCLQSSEDAELPSSLSQRKVFLTFTPPPVEPLAGPRSPERGPSEASFALPLHSSRSSLGSHSSRYSLCSSLDSTATRRHSDVHFPTTSFTRSVKPSGRLSAGCNPTWARPSSLDKEIGFIDSHCHLDMLYGKLGYRGSFGYFQDHYSSSFPSEFRGCVANFCNPRLMVKEDMWGSLLSEDSVWGAFGCHPHFAKEYSNAHERSILAAMRHPKAVAFGEMGLDYSHKNSTSSSRQKEVLERQLRLAVAMQKPLVIHCRDADEDLLEIMKRCVPWDYKIHRHCFTNAYTVIEPLLNHFPNLYVGFTALITYPHAKEPRDAVRKIPLNRIVVETDAPYFRPKQVARDVCQFAHPGMGIHTLREISLLKGEDLTAVFTTIRDNTVKLYGL
ncbi:putative deoxyribonuclease TATDN2 [Genypterus blacodes]|uniref:putative deoxyribonuclease TATDN2 n=1 Tax=Genypterus blacodes TaxID=154954 RepID=UPI003F76DF2B